MFWTNGQTDSLGVEVLEDPSAALLVAERADNTGAEESDDRRHAQPWPTLVEGSPALVLGARDPDEEEEEEEDADFFDDEDDDDDLDDDLEDEELDDEEEEDDDDDEDEEDDDF